MCACVREIRAEGSSRCFPTGLPRSGGIRFSRSSASSQSTAPLCKQVDRVHMGESLNTQQISLHPLFILREVLECLCGRKQQDWIECVLYNVQHCVHFSGSYVVITEMFICMIRTFCLLVFGKSDVCGCSL